MAISHLFNGSRLVRCFSTSRILAAKQLPPRPKLDDKDLTISYVKGSGPGGQKINKTNSAVQIIHKPTGIVVKSQATRSRSQNEKIARELLAEKVEFLEKGDQSRLAIKRKLEQRRKASRAKKSRRKYRALEEAKRKEREGLEAEKEEEGEELEQEGSEQEGSKQEWHGPNQQTNQQQT
ncbi:hypothetical protein VTN77DRAFT_5463 [Rasamsonia byssochlamydoides]|uniref:uncharacterized protein n=1 Tax=Rasamsonia byssochlamydoides TaxID=89139 RepID=UPI0037420A3E